MTLAHGINGENVNSNLYANGIRLDVNTSVLIISVNYITYRVAKRAEIIRFFKHTLYYIVTHCIIYVNTSLRNI